MIKAESERPILRCGCAANAFSTIDGEKFWSCVVHDELEPMQSAPNLEGRTAFCAYGKHAEKPSSRDLPFFEFKGEGSRDATKVCKCGYGIIAHDKPKSTCKCTKFEPRGPREHDTYYCGCRGWD